jgi:long-chain acyl-CoA synthetase
VTCADADLVGRQNDEDMPAPSRHLSAAPAGAADAATLSARLLHTTRAHHGTAVRFPRGGGVREWSFPQLGGRVRELGRGLMGLGLAPGDRVAILANTRPEWTLVDAAALSAGLVVVPVYHTNSPGEVAYVLEHSGARAIVCEDAGQLDKVEQVRHTCPELEHVFTIEVAGATPTLDDLAARSAGVEPAALHERAAAVRAGDAATIVYTSGTTGPPKGCVLTHANLVATMGMYAERVGLTSSAQVFLFLPLAHVLARVTQLVTLDVGGTLAFWAGDAATVIDDLATLKPTHVPAVPRVFEKVRTRALAKAHDAGGVREKLFDWALATGRRARAAERAGSISASLRARHLVADRLVLSKVRGLFGGRLELALTGAAPIAADVLEFFDACGVLVLEGYGMTESCAAATLNTPSAFRFGTVGRGLPGAQLAIADDGEVLLRGPHVFPRYHRDPDATAATFDGDWLCTGDLGVVDADGFLRITGRKKDLIITSSGKNVTPANIEAALRESRWISQALVAGDNRPYLVALLTLDPEEAPALAEQLGIPFDLPAMAHDERVHAVLRRDVDGANGRFARIEQVKRFAVLERDLSQAEEELTPTMKVKRAVVAERFADRIDALYEG